jgi:hypothetical protein
MLRDEPDATSPNVTHKRADCKPLRGRQSFSQGVSLLRLVGGVRRALRAFHENELIPIKDHIDRITRGATFIGEIPVSLSTGSFILPERKPSEHKDIHDGRCIVASSDSGERIPFVMCELIAFKSFNIHNIYLL